MYLLTFPWAKELSQHFYFHQIIFFFLQSTECEYFWELSLSLASPCDMMNVLSLTWGGRRPLESRPQCGFIFTLTEQWKSLSRFCSRPHDSQAFNWLAQMLLSSVSLGSSATSQGWMALCRRIRRCKAFPVWAHFTERTTSGNGVHDRMLNWREIIIVSVGQSKKWATNMWGCFLGLIFKRRSDSSRWPSE